MVAIGASWHPPPTPRLPCDPTRPDPTGLACRLVDVAGVLLETYGRVPHLARGAVDGLTLDQVLERPTADANPIAWLVWHMARLQDQQTSELIERDQLWITDGWAPRFGLEPDPANNGYGHTSAEVAQVRPESPQLLLDYLGAADARTCTMIASLAGDDLERIIDTSFDPPVTLGVRLVSIAEDCLQHCGQAAYVRGLLGA